MKYIHEHIEWPNFIYDENEILSVLNEVKQKQAFLQGKMAMLGLEDQEKINLEVLSLDVITSSAIEGENLNYDSVRSSIAQKLGLDIGGLVAPDKDADGIIEITLEATQNYQSPLTSDRLFSWHGALFPTGRSGLYEINVAAWRKDAMQVISGTYGKRKIHFEAVAPEKLKDEMSDFLNWFNADDNMEPILKSALAHLYFVTIHPFDDGNGRIARTLSDLLLARADNSPRRFYSLSTYIDKNRKSYYEILEKTRRGSLNITNWMLWFLNSLSQAIDGSEEILNKVLAKTKFWQRANQFQINERQRKVINLMLENFEGKMTTSKYAKLTKHSQDTALRDIQKLMEYELIEQEEKSGRSTSYRLKNFSE